MDKIYLSPNALLSKTCDPASEREISIRRIFNGAERRYLSLEALSMAYGLLGSRSVPHDVTESAVQQAVNLGSISGEEVDAQTFEVLFHAVSLNPSFMMITCPAMPMAVYVSSVERFLARYRFRIPSRNS